MLNERTAPYGALLLRVSLGVMFIAHAALKLMVFTLPGTVQFFESAGFPGFLAYVVTFAEFTGGVLLILGVYARWVALALIPILLGAASALGNGWRFGAERRLGVSGVSGLTAFVLYLRDRPYACVP